MMMNRKLLRDLRREISRYDDDNDELLLAKSPPSNMIGSHRSPQSEGAGSLAAYRNLFRQQPVSVSALNCDKLRSLDHERTARVSPAYKSEVSLSSPRETVSSVSSHHVRRVHLTPREHIVKTILQDDSEEEVKNLSGRFMT